MSIQPSAPRGHPVFAAAYEWLGRSIEAGPIGTARRQLLADAQGVVVDLGAGTGVNLPHLGEAVTQIHLVEPDPHMVRLLNRRRPDRAVIHQLGAEELPFADASIDTVLATLTLCTVGDPAVAAAEILRVLRPSGRLLVLEHVRSTDPRRAQLQDLLHVPWGWFGAGCDPRRDTEAVLTAAGFDTTGLTRLSVSGMLLASDWLTGRLDRPRVRGRRARR